MTLCFSVPQAIMAARAGARYISPFVGRFDDMSENGLEQVGNIVTAINNYDFTANTANGESRSRSSPPPCAAPTMSRSARSWGPTSPRFPSAF